MAVRVPTQSAPTVQTIGLPNQQRSFVNEGIIDVEPVARAASNIFINEKKKADTAALTQAQADLNKWQTESLYNPESGVYTKKAENALDVTNEYLPQFDAKAKEIGSRLSDDQRAQWEDYTAGQAADYDRTLNRYEFEQREQHYDNVTTSGVNTVMNAAALSAGNPDQVAKQRQFLQGIVGAAAARKGIDPGEALYNANSQFDANQVNALLAKHPTNPSMAYGYYLKAKPEMTYDDQTKAEATLVPLMQEYNGQVIAGQLLGGSAVIGDTTGGAPTGQAVSMFGSAPSNFYDQASMQVESSNRQFEADGKTTVLGPVTASGERAVGISQIMPSSGPDAAKAAGLPWDEQRLYNDKAYNIALGNALRKKYFAMYDNNALLGLAAYNYGPGNVNKKLKGYTDSSGVYHPPVPDPRKRAGGAVDYGTNVKGMTTLGNYDLNKLPILNDGKGNAVTSVDVLIDEKGKQFVVVPIVGENGVKMTKEEAMAAYKDKGVFIGKFDNPESAVGYASAVMQQQVQLAGDSSAYEAFMAALPEETRNYITKINALTQVPMPTQLGLSGPPVAGAEGVPVPVGAADAWDAQYAYALSQANTLDPSTRKHAIANLKLADDAKQKEFALQYNEALKYVTSGQEVPAELRNNLSGKDQLSLKKAEKTFRSGVTPVTDWPKWVKLQTMKPEEYRKLDLQRDILPFVGGAQIKEATDMWMEANGNKPAEAMTTKERAAANTKTILSSANIAGIKTGDTVDAKKPENLKMLDAFTAHMDLEIEQFSVENKRPPTTTEIKMMGQKAAFTWRSDPPGPFNTVEKPRYDLTKEEIIEGDFKLKDGVDDVDELPASARATLRQQIRASRSYINEEGVQVPLSGGVITDAMLVSTFNGMQGI